MLVPHQVGRVRGELRDLRGWNVGRGGAYFSAHSFGLPRLWARVCRGTPCFRRGGQLAGELKREGGSMNLLKNTHDLAFCSYMMAPKGFVQLTITRGAPLATAYRHTAPPGQTATPRRPEAEPTDALRASPAAPARLPVAPPPTVRRPLACSQQQPCAALRGRPSTCGVHVGQSAAIKGTWAARRRASRARPRGGAASCAEPASTPQKATPSRVSGCAAVRRLRGRAEGCSRRAGRRREGRRRCAWRGRATRAPGHSAPDRARGRRWRRGSAGPAGRRARAAISRTTTHVLKKGACASDGEMRWRACRDARLRAGEARVRSADDTGRVLGRGHRAAARSCCSAHVVSATRTMWTAGGARSVNDLPV